MKKIKSKNPERPVKITATFSEKEFQTILRDMKLGEKKTEYFRRKLLEVKK